jgi:hypothetical protein
MTTDLEFDRIARPRELPAPFKALLEDGDDVNNDLIARKKKRTAQAV